MLSAYYLSSQRASEQNHRAMWDTVNFLRKTRENSMLTITLREQFSFNTDLYYILVDDILFL